jgi:hypothetical protein
MITRSPLWLSLIRVMAGSISGNYIVTGQLGSATSKNYESPLLVWDAEKQTVSQTTSWLEGGDQECCD